MVIQQQLYSIDDVWDLAHRPENDTVRFELLNGELFRRPPLNLECGQLPVRIVRYLHPFVEEWDLGVCTIASGYHPPDDRYTVLAPNVAFTCKTRLSRPLPEKYVPLMPDLAVEIMSPNDRLRQIRRKAALYLQQGTQLVWIVLPAEEGVDVCRAVAGEGINIEFVGRDGTLKGEAVLPGFELPLKNLFPLP